MEEQKSEARTYVEFSDRYWRNIRVTLYGGAVALLGAATLLLFNFTHPSIGVVLITCIAVFITFYIQRFRLKHVLCPTCHKMCRSEVDKKTNEYKAFCDSCQMHWCLGVRKLFGLARTRGTAPTASETKDGDYEV